MTRCSQVFPLILLSFQQIGFALALLLAISMLGVRPAQARTFQTLIRFSGVNGEYPNAGLTIDAQGRLYGTTAQGGPPHGAESYGTVFRLTHHGAGWVQNVLYNFSGGADGAYPVSRVIFGPTVSCTELPQQAEKAATERSSLSSPRPLPAPPPGLAPRWLDSTDPATPAGRAVAGWPTEPG